MKIIKSNKQINIIIAHTQDLIALLLSRRT